jgi:microcystin-dependent protein
MSRNGSGTYTLPAGNPVVTGTTITTTWANTTLNDIASSLTGSVAADGQTPMSGSLNMANNKIISVLDPTLAQDAATKAYVDAVGFTVAPGTSGNLLTSNGTIWTSAAPAVSVPTGVINMWPTATAPTGYLLCTGTAISRSTYAALFAVIGTTFGVGDGSTTFNLPNYTNRMPYGTTVGATGGSADAVVVSHTHTATVTDPGHLHAGGWVQSGNLSRANTDTTGSYSNTASALTGISVANSTTGVNGTNANLPPYLGINFIIKV